MTTIQKIKLIKTIFKISKLKILMADRSKKYRNLIKTLEENKIEGDWRVVR